MLLNSSAWALWFVKIFSVFWSTIFLHLVGKLWLEACLRVPSDSFSPAQLIWWRCRCRWREKGSWKENHYGRFLSELVFFSPLLITLWPRVWFSFFCHPFSPAALRPFTGRAPNGSGQWRGGDSRPPPYSIYTHLLHSDLLVPGTTNPCSMLQHVHASTVPWGGMMLSEDGKMEERMREMAHAGCTGTGKAGTQQGLRPSCKYQDMLLFASQTAAIIWCRIHLVLQASVGSKGCLLLGTRSLLCKAASISGEILWYESQRWIQKRIQRARSLQV